MTHSILIVDDEDSVRSALRRMLRTEDYEIVEASNGADGLKMLQSRPIDIVISDHAMPHMTGIEFLGMASVARPDSIRIILTGQADLEMAVRAINEGKIYRFLLKPWDQTDFKLMLRLGVRQLDADRRTAQLLSLVRKQAARLETLQQEHPELFTVDRDDNGAILLTEAELAILNN